MLSDYFMVLTVSNVCYLLFNFLNLLNKNWGQQREYVFPYNAAVTQAQAILADLERGEGGRNALRQYSHRMDALVQQLFPRWERGRAFGVIGTAVE